MASIRRSGRYSTTAGATPASAAAAVLQVLGVAVDAEQLGVALEQRTTMSSGGPSSVEVTRTLWLVRPPGRSVTRQDRPASTARRSRSATESGTQSSKASTTAGSIVCFGPVNHFLADSVPPDRQQEQGADGEDRRVVDELPREVVAERVRRRGTNGSMK